MKSPIITISLCTLVGITSFYFGAKQVHDEQIAAMENSRFVNDLHRISIYRSTLEKLQNGQIEDSIQQLDQWLTADMQQVSGYKNQLAQTEQAQVDMVFRQVAQHRAQLPEASATQHVSFASE